MDVALKNLFFANSPRYAPVSGSYLLILFVPLSKTITISKLADAMTVHPKRAPKNNQRGPLIERSIQEFSEFSKENILGDGSSEQGFVNPFAIGVLDMQDVNSCVAPQNFKLLGEVAVHAGPIF